MKKFANILLVLALTAFESTDGHVSFNEDQLDLIDQALAKANNTNTETNPDLAAENAQLRESMTALEQRLEALENSDGADPSKVKKDKDKIDGKPDPMEKDLAEINGMADRYL